MAIAAEVIHKPLFTSTAHRIDLVIYEDEKAKTRKNIDGKTISVLLTDPGGSTFAYSASIDVAADGEAHITLTGSNHTTAGNWTAQLVVDDIPLKDFSGVIRERKTAT